MQNTRLSGTVPSGLGKLPKLQRLELAGNELAGQIPADLSNSASLSFIDLSHNRFQLPLPSHILSIPTLQSFIASDNQLTGEIPDQFQDCPSLAALDFSNNRLSGGNPASLASCERLVNLNLAGEVFRDIVGSAYYIAPEVLKRKYGPEVDIWSIGVMLYILLCGVPPFWAESEHGIFEAILQGQIDFTSDPWPNISAGAKDLVRKMLNSDPKQRLTTFEVLDHPWIKEDGEAPDTPLDNAVLNRLKQFRAMNKFKKAALRVIAGCLSEEEIKGLKEMFKNMDTDNSGTITIEELKQGLSKQGTKLSEYEVQQLMEAADADGNGTMDYEEFITATMHLNRMDKEEHLYTAFQFFDKDKSGYITKEELEQALKEKGMYDGREIKDIISEADADNDGNINYDEFVAMMKKGNPDANPKKRRDVFV